MISSHACYEGEHLEVRQRCVEIRHRAVFNRAGTIDLNRSSGHALMWGILYALDSNFGVTVSTGVNLSP